MDDMIILKRKLNKLDGRFLSSAGQAQVDGCCAQGNESPGSIKHGGIHELLKSYLLPKDDSVPRY